MREPAPLADIQLRRLVHELNTPVGVSAMAASLLPVQIDQIDQIQQSASALDASTRDSVTALLQELRECAALVQSSLQLCVQVLNRSTQAAPDRSPESLQPLDLKDCLERAVRMQLARHPGLQVSYYLHFAEPLHVRGDSGLWQQVVGNLVANSLLHGFDGRSHGTIQLAGTLLPGQRILVHYYDDGAGLTDEAYERLFEDHFTTRSGRGGSGLGMGIVQDLVHNKMGGQLEVHRPAQGVHISFEAAC